MRLKDLLVSRRSMSSIQQVLDEAWCMQSIADAQAFIRRKHGENVKLEERKNCKKAGKDFADRGLDQ